MLTKEQIQFLRSQSKLGIACSGGVDSMVLCHILLNLEIDFSIIHCNFQLRGEDSDKDLDFVKSFAEKQGKEFFSTSFETEKLAEKNNTSIEMEARNLRYQYFEQLISERGLDYVLLAHHRDDHIETILMRSITGAGLKGLQGISEFKGQNYYRPLLHISKEDIYRYANQHKIKFREDSSNFENDYLRNKIRNKIIPEISEINPSYRESISQLADIASQSEALIKFHFQELQADFEEGKIISFEGIKNEKFSPLIIAFILERYQINRAEIKAISMALSSSESKIFHLGKINIEVKNWTINQITKPLDRGQKVYRTIEEFLNDSSINVDLSDEYPKSFSPNRLYLDFYRIQFPLIRRAFRNGDRIQALGMNGLSKKVADIFQEMKWSLNEKNDLRIIEDNSKDIICILGYNISEKVKLNPDSSKQKVLIIEK